MVERNSVRRLQVRVDEVMTRMVFDEAALADDFVQKERKNV
jgi:hypothetical protein